MDSRVFLSLGSNLGDRKKNLEKACYELKKYIKIEKVSSIYETEALHYKEQDTFYNCGVQASSSIGPFELLKKAKETELRMGRVKSIRYGPRIIDIDIIFIEKKGEFISIKSDRLIVPHPMWYKRKFVIKTMKELDTERWVNGYLKENNINLSELNQEIIFVSDLNI